MTNRKCKIREDLLGLKVPVETMDGIVSFIEISKPIDYEWTEDCDCTGQIYITINGTKYRANSIDFEFI